MTVAFVFTNPSHHLQMMAPVADVLRARGVACELISLAELRGFDTPRDPPGLRPVIPLNIRKRDREPARDSYGGATRDPWSRGAVAKTLVWQVLRVRMWQLLRRAKVVVVPNDMVFPYVELLRDLRRLRIPTVLMQEGIRYDLPSGYTQRVYGGGGTAAICAWGEGTREYLVSTGVPAASIIVTGTPRLDGLDLDVWRERGRALLAARGLTSAPIAFLSNPIEIAGYGTTRAKLDLFAAWLGAVSPLARAQSIPIVVKTHMHESVAEFARVAAESSIADLVQVIQDPIFAVIAAARAAIVLTSTVGLESLIFGVPIAQLEIPGYGFAFEYVARGAAIPLPVGAIRPGMEALLAAGTPESRMRAAAFVERHIHDRGHAATRVADVIERVRAAAVTPP